MSVDKISAAAAAGLRQQLDSFFMPGDGGFTSKLTVGQVIKGRVLRHFEGDRYLVSFGGDEKVVDSAIPLSTNEVIRGKVVALGDKVELRRVHEQKSAAPDGGPKIELGVFGRYERLINEQFVKYRASLNQADAATLLNAVKTANKPESMINAGLVLAKLALPFSPELLRIVYDKLATTPGKGIFVPSTIVAEVRSIAKSAEDIGATERGLTAFVQQAMDDLVKRATPVREDDGAAGESPQIAPADEAPQTKQDDVEMDLRQDFGRFIFNAQSDSSVGHRVGTLLLRLGEQLREINVALFDQKNHGGQGELKHRQIVLSLDLDALGHVEVAAKTAGKHLSIRFTHERDTATAAMASAIGQLRQQLSSAGWTVDELSYETRRQDRDGVITTVVDHLIAQDSVSRLL